MPKFKGEIQVGKFCETAKKGAEAIQEESVVLSFKADYAAKGFSNPCELLGMTPKEVSDLIGDHDKAGIIVTGFTGQKEGVYNMTINGYEFVGNTFTSFEVKRVKKVGAIIILLRVRLGYQDKFHEQYPRFIKDVLDIEITEVNEQMAMPDPEGGEPLQDEQPKKTDSRYALGRICAHDDCEQPIRNNNRSGKCKEHR